MKIIPSGSKGFRLKNLNLGKLNKFVKTDNAKIEIAMFLVPQE